MKIASLASGLAIALALAPSVAPAQTTPIPIPANMVWREPNPEDVLVVETNKGMIIAELAPFAAPNAVERIKTLTRQKFYDGNEFFRVIEGFMDQTGDPQNTGRGASNLPDLKAEFSWRRGPDTVVTPVPTSKPNTGFIGSYPVKGQATAMMALTVDGKAETAGLFCTGSLGLARAGDPDSGNSQFFFMRDTTDDLNDKYTAFGRVLHGIEVVKSIKAGEPVDPPRDKMVRVRILADIPPAERPKVRAMDTRSPAFASYVETVKAKIPYFDICDIPIATPAPQ